MDKAAVTLCIVEADESVRRSLLRLMRSYRYRALGFGSASELLSSPELGEPGCIILDDDASQEGTGLPRTLQVRGLHLPVILMTTCENEERRAEAKRAGFSACFLKPVDDQALVDAIDWALSEPPTRGVSAAGSGGK